MSAVVRVKICGVTRQDDARVAVSLGASAIGFVFWPGSPRFVAPDVARQISLALPPFVTRVGVFVDASPDKVASTVSEVGLDVVQLHGEEDIESYRTSGARIVRVVLLENDAAVDRAIGLPADVLPLVDAVDRERRGGTGRRADWTRAARLAGARPTMLAGGLTAENVGEAIHTVRPWAVDTSSGVESAPGVKSPERMREFFKAIAIAGPEEL